jgi:hypothetical protein
MNEIPAHGLCVSNGDLTMKYTIALAAILAASTAYADAPAGAASLPCNIDAWMPIMSADIREKIKASQLINRLQGFILGDKDPTTKKPIEIDANRLRAIEILLKKSLPDLSAVSIEGSGGNGELQVVIRRFAE